MSPSLPEVVTDPRALGIALTELHVAHAASAPPGTAQWPAGALVPLRLGGSVYVAIFNPRDGRKNWQDILSAFCRAFREQPRATLVMKMTHHDMSAYVDEVFTLFRQLAPFACRVVTLHGYIDDEAYGDLVRATDFIVSASCGEGQCLPLMEYMAAGVPAIAPQNTAMRDYIGPDCAFPVKSTAEPTYWPHDPRQVLGTLRQRVSWQSLFEAFGASYALRNDDPDGYAAMGEAASAAQHAFCSEQILQPRLQSFLDEMRARREAGG